MEKFRSKDSVKIKGVDKEQKVQPNLEKKTLKTKKVEQEVQVEQKEVVTVTKKNIDELDDLLMSECTVRDTLAIAHLIPISNKEWLNELVNKISKRYYMQIYEKIRLSKLLFLI